MYRKIPIMLLFTSTAQFWQVYFLFLVGGWGRGAAGRGSGGRGVGGNYRVGGT